MNERESESLPSTFWNVPNSLTLGRLVLSVAVFGLIEGRLYIAALAVFALASLTDALDGYFARKLCQATAIGRQLDPFVDKVVVSGVFIFLLAIPGSGLAAWMVTTIVVRELLVQALRSLIEGQGEPFGAKWAGKLKMVAQCLAIVAILLVLEMGPSRSWLIGRDILIWTSVILTVYSGLGYLVIAWPKLRGEATAR